MRSVWQLVATLVIVAIVMKVIIWILLATWIAVAVWAARAIILAAVDRRKFELARRDGLVRRADQQHRLVMAGDPRGTYGQAYRGNGSVS